MGIRFRCHQCGHELHVKDFQGGKRSKCPECETKFRIPDVSAELSIPLGEDSIEKAASLESARSSAVGTLAANPLSAKSAGLEEEPNAGIAQPEEPLGLDAVAPEPPSRITQPQAIAEAPGATWYVRPPAGGQYGPAPATIFCEWLLENRVTRDALVWRDGWPQWLVAGDVFVDYFGPVIDHSHVPMSASAPAHIAGSEAEPTAGPEFVGPISLSDRALAARKRQRKKNYVIMIALLAVISVALLIALIVVLMRK